MAQQIEAIETTYAGVTFRSRLEARWAVFFDEMGIAWLYEPEGYKLPSGWYVPDFLLPSCGTFVEVRGHEGRVDVDDLLAKAAELPEMPTQGGERGPQLMLVGPFPASLPMAGDIGWLSFDRDEFEDCGRMQRCGFGTWHKNKRPWWLDGCDGSNPLEPTYDPYEWSDALPCYHTARSYRFWEPPR